MCWQGDDYDAYVQLWPCMHAETLVRQFPIHPGSNATVACIWIKQPVTG
jgi:hypothetical protein